MTKISWNLESKKVSELKEFAKNPRRLTEKGLKDLESSIKKFGIAEPIVVNADNMIVGGHGRKRVLEKLKIEQVDCYVPNRLLDDKEVDELCVRLNKNIAGEFDFDILANEFEMDDLLEWGFEEFELGGIDEEEPEIEEDEVPELKKESIVKRGDVWLLGSHKLKCGDSTLIDDVEDLMGGEKADMVFTDPPYNINFKPQRGTHDIIKNDNMSDEDFEKFLSDAFIVCKTVLKEDTYLISFMGWSTIPSFKKALEDLFKIKSMPIWVKNNFGIGYYTRPKYEPFYLCLNGEPEKPSSPPADVFEFQRVHKTIHSCEKPIGLIVDIIKHFVKKGLIYEPFAGSGSTLIASEQTSRKCFMMELDEHYCQVIIDRYINLKKNDGEDIYLLKDNNKIPYKEICKPKNNL